MNGKERSIVSNNIETLVEQTNNFDCLLSSLQKRGVFSLFIFEEINSLNFEKERIRLMYDYITTRGPSAYEHLISALFETDNDNLAKTLLHERYQDTDYLKIKVKIENDKRCDLDAERKGLPIYKMTSRPKGYALIINIHDYCYSKDDEEFFNENITIPSPPHEDNGRRFGSYRDVANLYSLLTQLGYEVTILYDLIKDRFLEEIKKFSEKPEHYSVDSCVVVVMSHGQITGYNGATTTYDNKLISITDIWSHFNSHNCPALLGKPKIFIFQMCLGNEDDMGVEMCIGTNNNIVKVSNGHSGNLSQQINEAVKDVSKFQDVVYKSMNDIRIPSMTDFFFIFPCAPGYTSKRSVVTGSWLIQKICKVFMNHASELNLYELVKIVAEEVNTMFSISVGTQTTWSMDSAKYIFFNPGIYDDSLMNNMNIHNS